MGGGLFYRPVTLCGKKPSPLSSPYSSIPPAMQVPPPRPPIPVDPQQPPLPRHTTEVLPREGLPGVPAGDPIRAGGLEDLHPPPLLPVRHREPVIAPGAAPHLHRPWGGEELQRQ